MASLPSYSGMSSFKTWVFSIAKNKAKDVMRRLYRFREETALDVANMESACDFSSDCDFTDVMNDVIDIRRAVASLSSDERELISLIFTHGMSYSEVSLVMGMPVGTVKAKCRPSRQNCGKYLGGVLWIELNAQRQLSLCRFIMRNPCPLLIQGAL